MKIVHTPARFYPYMGGVENHVYNLTRELAALGQDVHVICAKEPSAEENETVDGVKIKRIPYITKISNTNITPQLPCALLKEYYDVIHTHMPTPWSADWSALAARLKSRPLVLTYHNDIVGQGPASHIARLYNFTALKLVLAAASKIIVTQPYYLRFSPYLKDHREKVGIVPNGVDVDRFRPRNGLYMNGHTLFFLSLLDRFHEYKGLEYLLEALVIVKERVPGIKLIIGGVGELLEYYKNKAGLLGLAENIEFAGFIPEDKLAYYYNLCDIFILPSTSAEQEGFGIVLLEAMACKKPVVSTEIAGVAQDVRACNAGKIIRPKDAKALSKAIVEILMDKELAEEMGKRGRRLVEEKYTWKKVGRDVLQIYQELA